MSTISLGGSGIVGISYSETNLLKSNLMRANDRRNSASNNINSAKVKLQVNGSSGRIRVESNNLQSYYSSLKGNNGKIEKIIRDIDYIVRRFKEVDSRCASRVRAISRGYKLHSSISRIGNTLIYFGSNVFKRVSSFLKDGVNIMKSSYKSTVNWVKSYGFNLSLVSGNVNLRRYPGIALSGMGMFRIGITDGMIGPVMPGGVAAKNEAVQEYFNKSLKQVLLGNFTDGVILLGTIGQVAVGLLGVDLPLDIRDIAADFINWEWSWSHAGQTVLDIVVLLPVIGAIKYADEGWVLLKNGYKSIKNIDISPLIKYGKEIGVTILKNIPDLTKNLPQYFKGGINEIGNYIDEVLIRIQKGMAFEPELVADGVKIGNLKDTSKLDNVSEVSLNEVQKNYNNIVNGGESIKTSYVKSIADLKNTDNFTDNALEHILEGEINRRGKAVGFHYEGFPTTKGSVIEGTKSIPDDFGVYTGSVEVSGIPKTSNGGQSTFFPESWTAQEVVDAINEAFTNREFVQGTRNTYIGELKNGMQIEMYIDNFTNKIISAFPIQ